MHKRFIAFYALVIPLNLILGTVWAAALIAAVGCTNITIATAFLGTQSGIHLFMVPIAGLTALMTRPAHWLLSSGIAVLSVVLFTYMELAFDEGLIAPYSDAVLDGLLTASIIGAVTLSLLPPLLYRQLVAQAEADLQAARDRAERLLFAILPPAIAHRLDPTDDTAEQVIADRFDSVTVLFADVVGFTARTAAKPAESVVAGLNSIFSDFDTRADSTGSRRSRRSAMPICWSAAPPSDRTITPTASFAWRSTCLPTPKHWPARFGPACNCVSAFTPDPRSPG